MGGKTSQELDTQELEYPIDLSQGTVVYVILNLPL